MKITRINQQRGIAELSGVKREVCLKLVKGIKTGDYVMIHAGFAIEKLDEKEALRTLSFFEKEA